MMSILAKVLCGVALDVVARIANIFSGIRVDGEFRKDEFVEGGKKYIWEILTILFFSVSAIFLPMWLSWCGVDLAAMLQANFGSGITVDDISILEIIIIYGISIINYLLKTTENIKKVKEIKEHEK